MKLSQLTQKFTELFGHSAHEIRAFIAPGRVNLIGEHTDYNGGYVFPAALTLATTVLARRRDDNIIRLAATTIDASVCANLATLEAYKGLPWGSYQLGMAYTLQQAGFAVPGCDLLYDSTLPFGSGLSSSASIEVATGFALLSLAGQSISSVKLAQLAQRAENDYVGMSCGIMDQFASANGKADHAILLDCNTLQHQHIPLNLGKHEIVLVNTNRPHALVTSAYNTRRAECQAALDTLRAALPELPSLCALSTEQFEQLAPRLSSSPEILRRARHVVSENARTLRAVEVLKAGDLTTFGVLMRASHVSLRDDYQVTCKELDALYDIGAFLPGVIGLRMTGAGFGGCVVALVEHASITDFERVVAPAYKEQTGLHASFYVCRAGDGVREIALAD